MLLQKSVTLSEGNVIVINKEAEKLGISFSEVLRRLIDNNFNQNAKNL